MLQEFLELCGELKVPVAKDKTEWVESVVIFLGILLHGKYHLLVVPEEKSLKALHSIQNLLARRSARVKDLEQVTGLLNFLNKAEVPGRAFTRRMYSKFTGNPALKPYHHIRLDGEFKADCKTWEQFLTTTDRSICQPFIDLSIKEMADVLNFYTDAAKGETLGFGGVFNKHWIVGQWPENFIAEKDPSIEFLELFGVVTAVIAWAQELQNRRIVLFCDNQSVVAMINNSSSKCQKCMILIRILTFHSMK